MENKIFRGSKVGSVMPNEERAKEINEKIESESERMGELYKVTQTLENKVKMPGTYISMGVYNTFSFYGASK